ncbi:TPA: raqprd family integrative conjugative element protein [Klebsiella quasipneumoniae subsp. similipneumoniae]|nr:raqprd family integrative conjugative element protein [Klebsiella quasipneumoniae subsp. similipneumoniae]
MPNLTQQCAPALVFVVLSMSLYAAEPALERARLSAMLRQLDMIDREAEQRAAQPPVPSRYHFDYARLHNDLQHVRFGIHNYLEPARNQPRDITPLIGSYTDEQDAPP